MSDFEQSDLGALKAELASLKAVVAGMMSGGMESGLDFSSMSGSDDDVMPNVPIGGGGIDNFSAEPNEDESATKIGLGVVCIGRKHYRINPSTQDASGEFRLKISLEQGDASITLEKGSGFESPNGTVSYIPLYKVEKGMITEDYRGNFCVVARE